MPCCRSRTYRRVLWDNEARWSAVSRDDEGSQRSEQCGSRGPYCRIPKDCSVPGGWVRALKMESSRVTDKPEVDLGGVLLLIICGSPTIQTEYHFLLSRTSFSPAGDQRRS